MSEITPPMTKSNPYDYDHAVADPGLFAGRKDELASIEDHISRLIGPTPIPPLVAIVGERRVGKTSLMLRAAEICNEHRIIPAFITLNRITATDAWEFWREVFDSLVTILSDRELIVQDTDARFGFLKKQQGEPQAEKGKLTGLQFGRFYSNRGHLGLPLPPIQILRHDLQMILSAAQPGGFSALLLLLDEAHHLVGSHELLQQMRDLIREVRRYGVLFAGERILSQLFNDPSEPLFAQGRVIPLSNFLTAHDIASCALLPLTEEERPLMSPMTINHLAQLSKGKPNQIRLICHYIYHRYLKGEQNDLNINIHVLEDVLEQIERQYTPEYNLRSQVDKIRRLNSVDLEILYNMTRYPDWRIQDVIDLDESFRGEGSSGKARLRRFRRMDLKRSQFIEMGLLQNERERCILAGDEFLYLYLRFHYELRKYGGPSRRIEVGHAPITPFGEKTEKLVRALTWELARPPVVRWFTYSRAVAGQEDAVATVRRRFAVLQDLLSGVSVDFRRHEDIVNECFEICELIAKTGLYHLAVLSVRSLEDPRESMKIELYFDKGEEPFLIPLEAVRGLRVHAEGCKILIEDWDQLGVTIPDLPGLLKAIGLPNLEELIEHMGPVERWRVKSVRHLVTQQQEEQSRDGEKTESEEDKEEDWYKLYERGDVKGSEAILTKRLLEARDPRESAKLYNDRGYIRYGLNLIADARRDLDRAVDLHYILMQLTLLNLAVIDIDQERYDSAVEKIEDALLLTLGREHAGASYLRLRLLSTHLTLARREQWEQHPANTLEAAYINMAYALTKAKRIDAAVDALQEGLEVLPSSVRLKHALARLYLYRKRADLANPMYAELLNSKLPDPALETEARAYYHHALRGRKR